MDSRVPHTRFDGKRVACLQGIDGLMFRSMKLKDPANIFQTGNKSNVSKEDRDSYYAIHKIKDHLVTSRQDGAGFDSNIRLGKLRQKSRKSNEERDAEADGKYHRCADS